MVFVMMVFENDLKKGGQNIELKLGIGSNATEGEKESAKSFYDMLADVLKEKGKESED